MAKLIHSMIRVRDLDASIAFYDRALGLKIADRYDFDGFTLVYLRNEESDFEVELTWNHDRNTAYSHGEGYGHIAVAVDDLEAEHARLTDAELAPMAIKEFYREEALMARFFFIKDPDGYKIEFLQRHGRYR